MWLALTHESHRHHRESARWFESLGVDTRLFFCRVPPGFETAFRQFTVKSTRPSPKDWADSYLAAFAEVSGFTIVTFDRGFQARGTEALVLEG